MLPEGTPCINKSDRVASAQSSSSAIDKLAVQVDSILQERLRPSLEGNVAPNEPIPSWS